MAKPLPLSFVLEQLSRHLAQVPAETRDVSIAMMGNFARYPEAHERVEALFTTLLHSPAFAPKPEPKVRHLRPVQ